MAKIRMYALLIWIALTVGLIWYGKYWRGVAEERGDKVTQLESELEKEKSACDTKIKSYNKKQQKADAKIEKVREAIKEGDKCDVETRVETKIVKSDCDCWNAPLPDNVKRVLHSDL